MLRMFSVFDAKARNFNTPFFMRERGEALRAFADLANDLTTLVGRHPSDFTLYEVGTFDPETGRPLAAEPPVAIGLAASLVRPPEQAIPQLPFRIPPAAAASAAEMGRMKNGAGFPHGEMPGVE